MFGGREASVRGAEMLFAVIAGERAGAGVERAVAIRTIFIPATGPWLGIAVIIDDSRFRVVAAHRGGPWITTIIVIAGVVIAGLRVVERTNDQGAGREAKDACRDRIAIATMVVPVTPVTSAGRWQGRERGRNNRGGQDGGLENRFMSVSFVPARVIWGMRSGFTEANRRPWLNGG